MIHELSKAYCVDSIRDLSFEQEADADFIISTSGEVLKYRYGPIGKIAPTVVKIVNGPCCHSCGKESTPQKRIPFIPNIYGIYGYRECPECWEGDRKARLIVASLGMVLFFASYWM